MICWAVGVLEKVVLRWRRKGAGLRGFRQEMESIDESEDEDIIKVFRKQKVEGAIDEAVSIVRSMVDSPDARQQYSRVLGRYRQAKVIWPRILFRHCTDIMHINYLIRLVKNMNSDCWPLNFSFRVE